jgi:hypothetical protein
MVTELTIHFASPRTFFASAKCQLFADRSREPDGFRKAHN